jgi:hypothetical protein
MLFADDIVLVDES